MVYSADKLILTSLPSRVVLTTTSQKTNLDHCICSVVSCIIIVLQKIKQIENMSHFLFVCRPVKQAFFSYKDQREMTNLM